MTILKILRAIAEFDFTLFCAGATGLFFGMSVVYLAIQEFNSALESSITAVVFLAGTLYQRKVIKAALNEKLEKKA